jgi:Putative porin
MRKVKTDMPSVSPLKKLFLTAGTLVAALLSQAYAQEPITSAAPSEALTTSNSSGSVDPDLRSELEQLKELLREQQKRIDALEAERNPKPPEAASLPKHPTASEPSPGPVNPVYSAAADPAPSASPDLQANAPPPSAQAQPQAATVVRNVQAGSSDERIRNLERQVKGLGPISFSGDVRLRGEPFFGGPTDQSLDRMRGRVRARFNALADLGSQFRTGITLASGDVNDPTSTNQNLTGFYTRKAVALDQAFVDFTPNRFKALSLTGGKFRYPWFNTELTWDKDLNPEGAAQTLGFHLDTPVLKHIAVVAFELPFAEVAGLASTNKSITQQITYGGQLQTAWQIAPHVMLSAYSGFYDFIGADSIALALARASSKNPQTPFVGLLPLASSNPVQDSTYTTTSKTIITVAGKSYPTGVSSVTNAQFASKFELFDNIAKFDIDTGSARFPLSFIGDYVQNTAACDNLANISAAPANTTTATFTRTLNSPCISKYRRGYWAEARIGRLQEKNDIQLGYTRIYIEREAVLGNFNYSEIRQGTNVSEHRFDSFYQFDRNVQLGFTALIGRPLASKEPWLDRLQFDAIYIF